MFDALIGYAISMVFFIPFILTLRRTMLLCSTESRSLSPRLIWLLLIPFFTFVWSFVVVVKLAESLHKEFLKREIETDKAPGQTIGLAASTLSVIAIIPNHILDLVVIVGLPAVICWIIYWIKMWRFSVQLKAALQAAQPGS